MPRLLIVEDESSLLDLIRRYLERVGYEAEAFTDPSDALASFQRDPHRFALVISDLTLPGMDGEELIERIRKLNPAVPALIASGKPYEPVLAGVGFLQK